MIPSSLALVLSAGLAAGPVSFVVTPAGPGPQRLDVPPALLSASTRGDLADLRLHAQEGGREDRAYLLVPPADEPPRRRAAVRIRAIPATKKASGAELDLGATAEVIGVRLDVPARASFVRALRVDGSVDGARWATLAEGAVWALEREGCVPPSCERWLRGDEVRFPAARARYLRVVFDDRRAPPLPPLRGAEAILAPSAAAAPGPAVPLAVARRDGEPGVSRFALVLPGPHLPVRAVRLDVDARHLFRSARVVEQRLEGGRLVPHVLGQGQLVRAERDGVTVAALELAVARPEEQELELAAEDGDGGPLPLRGAEALLAPLPWIYLESPDGRPLAGDAGVPSRAPPRYDLEAIRPELAGPRAAALPRARLTFAEARAAGPGAAAPEAAPDAARPGAPVDATAFRVSRAVAAAAPGLAAVRLDAAALAVSPDLSDVRLATADGHQLPYLAESRPEPLRIPVEPSAPLAGTPASRPGATVRAVPLEAGAAPASRLVLETSARVFTRTVRVYADAGDAGASERRAVAEATWAHADPGRPAPALTVDLPPLRADRLLVALDDGDNAPLPISAAALLLPAWRLRFFHPGGDGVRLLQAASGLAPPRYDLALLAPRLREAPAREVGLGPPPPPPRRMPGARAWFWAALGAAVLGLLALVARLVRAGPGEGAPPA